MVKKSREKVSTVISKKSEGKKKRNTNPLNIPFSLFSSGAEKDPVIAKKSRKKSVQKKAEEVLEDEDDSKQFNFPFSLSSSEIIPFKNKKKSREERKKSSMKLLLKKAAERVSELRKSRKRSRREQRQRQREREEEEQFNKINPKSQSFMNTCIGSIDDDYGSGSSCPYGCFDPAIHGAGGAAAVVAAAPVVLDHAAIIVAINTLRPNPLAYVETIQLIIAAGYPTFNEFIIALNVAAAAVPAVPGGFNINTLVGALPVGDIVANANISDLVGALIANNRVGVPYITGINAATMNALVNTIGVAPIVAGINTAGTMDALVGAIGVDPIVAAIYNDDYRNNLVAGINAARTMNALVNAIGVAPIVVLIGTDVYRDNLVAGINAAGTMNALVNAIGVAPIVAGINAAGTMDALVGAITVGDIVAGINAAGTMDALVGAITVGDIVAGINAAGTMDDLVNNIDINDIVSYSDVGNLVIAIGKNRLFINGYVEIAERDDLKNALTTAQNRVTALFNSSTNINNLLTNAIKRIETLENLISRLGGTIPALDGSRKSDIEKAQREMNQLLSEQNLFDEDINRVLALSAKSDEDYLIKAQQEEELRLQKLEILRAKKVLTAEAKLA